MSSVVISGDTSGAITLSAPAVSGTNTATLPAATGTVMASGNMPAFSAYLSANQTPITNGTFTKIQCNTEEFDTASAYDNATNYRFTPQIAGYYQVSGCLNITSSVANSECLIAIYKNGTSIKWGSYITRAASGFDVGPTASALIYLNGSTDYVELYGYISGTGTLGFIGSQQRTFFQAVLVRAA